MVLVHYRVWCVTISWHFFPCCVKITEISSYNKKWKWVACGGRSFCSLPMELIVVERNMVGNIRWKFENIWLNSYRNRCFWASLKLFLVIFCETTTTTKTRGVVNSPCFNQIFLHLDWSSFGWTPSNWPSSVDDLTWRLTIYWRCKYIGRIPKLEGDNLFAKRKA